MPQLFGVKLRRARLERQWTQVELAQQLGLAAHVHISKLEVNKDQPSLSLAVRAARILQISMDYLLRDTMPVENLVTSDSVARCNASIEQSFGARLKTLRLQHNLNQRELAEKLGITSRAYIATLEKEQDKLPSIDLVVKIADLFGVTTDYLLQETVIDRSLKDD